MTENDIKLKLLANVPIPIDGIGYFQLPNIREVIEMNESKYRESMSWLLFSKDQLQSQSEDVSEYSEMEIFIALLYSDLTFRQNVFAAFKVFLNSEPQILENGLVYFNELSEESILTEEKWEFIKKLIRMGNYLEYKKEEEYIAGNERARKFMEKLKKKKELQAKTKKEQSNLHNLISAVGWKADSFFDVSNLTVYQLYNGYFRLGMIDHYHFTLTGIYAGNVDGKKIKMPDINWANTIKLN